MTTDHYTLHKQAPILLSGSFDLLSRSSYYDEGHLVGTSMSLMQPAFYYSGFNNDNNVNTNNANRPSNTPNRKVTMEPHPSTLGDERLYSSRFLDSLLSSSWSSTSNSISKSKKSTSLFFPAAQNSSSSTPPPPPPLLFSSSSTSTPLNNPFSLLSATTTTPSTVASASRPPLDQVTELVVEVELDTKPAPQVESTSSYSVLSLEDLPLVVEPFLVPVAATTTRATTAAAATTATVSEPPVTATTAATTATTTASTLSLTQERQAMKEILRNTKLQSAPLHYMDALVELIDNCLYEKVSGNRDEYMNVATLEERLKTCLSDLVRQRCLSTKKKTSTMVSSSSSSPPPQQQQQESVTTASSSVRSFPKTTREQGVFLDHIFQIMDL